MVRPSFTILAFAACVSVGVAYGEQETGIRLSGDVSSLLLIQRHSEVKKGHSTALPDVSSVWSKPKAIVDEMTSQVGALEGELTAVQRQSAKAIAKKRARYEHNLTALHAESRAIKAFNTKMSNDIAALEASNAQLRAQGSELLQQNRVLVADLNSLKRNISIAQEFLSTTMNRSEELLGLADELTVLHELAREDELRSKQAAFAHGLDLSTAPKSMSAVQLSASVRGHGKEEDAHGLLKSMTGALAELQEEQKASEEALREKFEQAYIEAVKQRTKLLSEQEELNNTKAHALDVQSRLTTAVSHLRDAHVYFQQQVDGLRSFAKRLSESAAPPSRQGSSLLQTASHKRKPVPSIATGPRGPSSVMDSLNSHMTELQDVFAQVNQRSIDEASEQRMEYDGQLTEVRNNISHQRIENSKVQAEIAHVDESVAVLRRKAEELANINRKLRGDLKLIQGNISLAQEYVAQLLEDTHEPLNHTKDLKVLHDLAVIDAAKSAEQAHEQELKKLSKVALLQEVGQERKPHGHDAPAHKILSSIESSMKVLLEQHNATRQELRLGFEREFTHEQKEYSRLLQEWSTLNTSKFEKVELQHRLEVAVNHLDHTGKVLTKKRESLLGFAAQLAALQDPTESEAMSATKGRLTSLGKSAQNKMDTISRKAFNVIKNFPSSFGRKDVGKVRQIAQGVKQSAQSVPRTAHSKLASMGKHLR